VAFTSGPNNFPATKACLQLPYDIQSDPRHNWRFKFSSTRRHPLDWSPYMTPKFLGLHGCCSLVPKKPRAPACTQTYNSMTPQFSAGSYVPKASITTCRKLVTHCAHGPGQYAWSRIGPQNKNAHLGSPPSTAPREGIPGAGALQDDH
jgi:hypothetical protein